VNKKLAVLAIDQGTTSSRAIVFDQASKIVATAQQEFAQIFPQLGWVEHDPEQIWQTSLTVARKAFEQAEAHGYHVVSIGITNQRETTLVWRRDTLEPIYNAIVWQDRRTSVQCQKLKLGGHEADVSARSGLLIDPYFSATKVSWILDNVSGAREQAKRGELAFGTVDSFLISKLTQGSVHATDATNASRTNLYNIHSNSWDPVLLELFNVPDNILPQILDSADDYGATTPDLFGRSIPITGVVGDQQGASIGQCCFKPGAIKSTYGTGCFVMLNTGKKAVSSKNRLLTTIAYRLNGETTYALEGSIFMAGAAVQWLRDGLKIIDSAQECEAIAQSLEDSGGVYMVPAFTGLGAPWWQPDARGAILGLTRDSGQAQIIRATLESVCYQSADLFAAMAKDDIEATVLRVDGGMVQNSWLIQYLADIIDVPVQRPSVLETTALGAAYLSGLYSGVFESLEQLASNWRCDSEFSPQICDKLRQQRLDGWHQAVNQVIK